ncbi:MAG: penicillin-binding transpeptidase domain-containing protein, partial [Monoglobales bacterium]
LKSVEIISEPVRTYGETGIAAHMLGRVDKIYSEEYEKLKSKNYGMNDKVGKDGLEKYLEDFLRGTDGLKGRNVSLKGETVTLSEDVPAIPGNKVVLSIDYDVQLAAEKALDESVRALYNDGAANVGGGAAVAIDVNSGEVIAMASNPTYNLTTFKENYNSLLNNPKNPMFNRAIAGAYPPGSTFKALTAIAGLQEGVIRGDETIYCNGPYQAYAPSYTPACWIYNDYGGSHEHVNVTKALEVSCNIFFYETGRRLGIETLNDYGIKFGLGQPTGIELSGETEGVLAGPEYRKSIDKIWYPGDTIQAAIGQSDNMFTPLQMANYTATIANGGVRYKPHLVKSIMSYDGKKTIAEFSPEKVSEIDISPENLKYVHSGMRAVCVTGSAKVVFGDYDIAVAGKTGTAQSGGNRTPHSWFISFAPYDNPQIAVAVVIEHAGINGLGKHVYNVAKAMYDAYFKSNERAEIIKSNTILN